MGSEYAVYGKFKGKYKTNQILPLMSSEAYPTDKAHEVQVYQGGLEAISFDDEYEPEKHRVFSSYILRNVENITVKGTADGPFSNEQIYDFTQLIIINPKIESAHDMNGATYGELSGMAYGKTQDRPKISKLDPPEPPPPNKNQGATGNSGFNDHSEIGDYLEKAKNGCSYFYDGCIRNFWRILQFLLLLLFLWWLIKSCSAIAERKDCSKRDQNKIILENIEKKRDSLRVKYKENLNKALANINNVYFYRGTSEVHQYSLGFNGNLERLKHLLSVYEDTDFIIEGHHSGASVESDKLDMSRAESVRNEFINAGISAKRLEVVTKGDSEPLEKNMIYPYMFPDYSLRYYNRNMRVEIRIKKK